MSIINFKVNEEKKKEIEEITKLKGYKSVSEFIREAIDDKMNLQKIVDKFKKKNPTFDLKKIDIPDYIPDGKYLGIARNTIICVGDSIQEVMKILFEKFPEAVGGIIRKGKEVETFEVLYSLFSAENTKCYHQIEIDNNNYPIIAFSMVLNDEDKPIIGLIDTGASIMTIDENYIKDYDFKPIHMKKIITANGIIKAPIYKGTFQYENQTLKLEFTTSNISGPLGIQALIGKNFIDKFNLLFLGTEKLFCVQII
ncbi:MAG: ribbon-helix-helix protein, CopG family [Promethearchaeota archaeon]